MSHRESDWIFNIGLNVAVAIFLATLAMGLITGVGPITAVLRSGAAFGVFTTIGWAAALMWQPTPEEPAEAAEEANAATQGDASAGRDDAGQDQNVDGTAPTPGVEPFEFERFDSPQTAQQAT